jgi:hypothetical protein
MTGSKFGPESVSPARNMPRHLPIQPHDAVAPDRETCRTQTESGRLIFRLYRSNKTFDEPSRPSCMMPIPGSYPSAIALIRTSPSRTV